MLGRSRGDLVIRGGVDPGGVVGVRDPLAPLPLSSLCFGEATDGVDTILS
jgi:hypothetical protein